jgi:hypothetical protein
MSPEVGGKDAGVPGGLRTKSVADGVIMASKIWRPRSGGIRRQARCSRPPSPHAEAARPQAILYLQGGVICFQPRLLAQHSCDLYKFAC